MVFKLLSMELLPLSSSGEETPLNLTVVVEGGNIGSSIARLRFLTQNPSIEKTVNAPVPP